MTAFTIYLFCLVVGLVFTLFSVLAGHFLGGHGDHVGGSGGHAEAGADSSDMPGISIFSPTVIAAFVTAQRPTAIDVSRASGTVAVGDASGALYLLKLEQL